MATSSSITKPFSSDDAVAAGRSTGIFTTWGECEAQ
ncbi:hypothetical protein L917_19893, partial [Phytophthora nicotianae]